MKDRSNQPSIIRQGTFLGISRGSAYYRLGSVFSLVLALMCRIDELHLDYPFPGSPMLQGLLLGEGYKVGRFHARTLMKRMSIKAIYRHLRSPAPPQILSLPSAQATR
jgi:putative transposase